MTIIFSIITVILLSISVWQIAMIFEVSNLGKKKDDSQVANYKDNDFHGKRLFSFGNIWNSIQKLNFPKERSWF